MPVLNRGNQHVGFLLKVERLLQIVFPHRLIGFGQEQSGILDRLAVLRRERHTAQVSNPLANGAPQIADLSFKVNLLLETALGQERRRARCGRLGCCVRRRAGFSRSVPSGPSSLNRLALAQRPRRRRRHFRLLGLGRGFGGGRRRRLLDDQHVALLRRVGL